MFNKLSQKDVKALKIGITGVIIIVVLYGGMVWLENWVQIRKSLAAVKLQLKADSASDLQQKLILSAVPVIELPQPIEEQQFLFRDKFSEQLRNAGIRENQLTEPLKFVTVSKSPVTEYKLLCIQCKATARFEQILNLLAELKNNPYLVSVEDFIIKKTDAQNSRSRDFELDLKISTFMEN